MSAIAVTGASAGMGRATVERFARRGARIGLLAREPDRLEAAAAEVERLGGEALVLPLDVADHDAVDEAASTIEERFGPLDVWVNSAMATVFAPVTKITPEEFRRATEVTYLGYVWGTLAALRRMLPRDRGTIVQVGSALAYRSIPLQAPYCAAKHAVHGFTQSLRTELLAQTGYDSQQTDEQLEGEREGNLFEPVPGDVGAHGRFCDRAKGRSLLLDLKLLLRARS